MSLKIIISRPNQPAEIRRISPTPQTWNQLQITLSQLLPQEWSQSAFVVQYEDDEQEMIRINSDPEWNEALRVLQSQNIQRIYISETVVDKPPVFHEEEEVAKSNEVSQPDEKLPESSSSSSTSTENPEPYAYYYESIVAFSESFPRLLQDIFEGKPVVLPLWLKQALQQAKSTGQQKKVDLDHMYTEFVEKGSNLLHDQVYEKAKKAFESLLALKEQHPEFLQLLAMAEAVSNEGKIALTTLQQNVKEQVSTMAQKIQSTSYYQSFYAQNTTTTTRSSNDSSDDSASLVSFEHVPEKNILPPLPTQTLKTEETVDSNNNFTIKHKYEAQLQTLSAMGFRDVEVNTFLLDEADGDLDSVVNSLLQE